MTSSSGTDATVTDVPSEAAAARASNVRLGLFGAAGLLTAISWQVVIPVLPLHLARIGYSAAQIGLLASLLSLAMGLVELEVGRIAAVFGRRWTLLGGLALHGIALLWAAEVRAAAAVGGALAAVGTARATMWTPLMAGVAEDAAAHARGRIFGTFWSVTSVGFLVGPAVGGFVASQYGDRAAFYLGTALSLIAMPVILPITNPGRPATPEPRVRPAEVLRDPAFFRLCLANHLHYAVAGIWMTFLPLYAATQGLSVLVIGEIFAVQGLTYALCQFPTGRLADRIGPERLIIPAVIGPRRHVAPGPAASHTRRVSGRGGVVRPHRRHRPRQFHHADRPHHAARALHERDGRLQQFWGSRLLRRPAARRRRGPPRRHRAVPAVRADRRGGVAQRRERRAGPAGTAGLTGPPASSSVSMVRIAPTSRA